MTPTQLAVAECANYDQGRCLGVTADSLITGHLVLAKNRGQCTVQEKRCGYFEECVLPMADSEHPDAGQYATARNAYQRKFGQVVADGSLHRCPCGEIIGKRKSLCVRCATRNRRESFRSAQNRRRNGSGAEIAMSVNN